MLSRSVVSNQDGPHLQLDKTVCKHRDSVFAKPYSAHSEEAFATAQRWLQSRPERPLIFDSCCGVGQSSRIIAAENPDCHVVAVDKSEHRLQRGQPANPENLLLLRADLNDFYRLAAAADWRPQKHYILYPNPWPKAAHLGRRWHGAPVFPHLLALGGDLILRSNWLLYLQEFELALQHYRARYHITTELQRVQVERALTPFEAKYDRSGQALWQLTASVSHHLCDSSQSQVRK